VFYDFAADNLPEGRAARECALLIQNLRARGHGTHACRHENMLTLTRGTYGISSTTTGALLRSEKFGRKYQLFEKRQHQNTCFYLFCLDYLGFATNVNQTNKKGLSK
jgi:hypothetical protein